MPVPGLEIHRNHHHCTYEFTVYPERKVVAVIRPARYTDKNWRGVFLNPDTKWPGIGPTETEIGQWNEIDVALKEMEAEYWRRYTAAGGV